MCTCPICHRTAVGPIDHGTAQRYSTPEYYAHTYHGRVYWHRMDWSKSAPEGIA